jgi:DNA-binding transcriptional ArsR family regulator
MSNQALDIGYKLLKAMGNFRRLQILFEIRKQEKSVGELCKAIGLGQSALSQHLAILRKAKLVRTRRNAQTIYYSISNAVVLNILSLLDRFYNQNYK